MRRFFLHENAIKKDQVTVCGPDAHHIKNVLRLEKGYIIELIDTYGQSYKAKITNLSNDKIQTEIIETIDNIVSSEILKITVAQSMLKDKKNDILVRQATELGISRWISFLSERSISRPNKVKMKKKINRWKTIAISAAQQSKRNFIPIINEEIMFLEDIFSLVSTGNQDVKAFFFWEKAQTLLKREGKKLPKEIILIFGPEGGFSDKEAKQASDCGLFIRSLGPRILKSETATVAGLAVIQYIYGNF